MVSIYAKSGSGAFHRVPARNVSTNRLHGGDGGRVIFSVVQSLSTHKKKNALRGVFLLLVKGTKVCVFHKYVVVVDANEGAAVFHRRTADDFV